MKDIQMNKLWLVWTTYVTSSLLHQILWNKMVKITKNKRYEYRKLKTGSRCLNKWPNVRKSQIEIHWWRSMGKQTPRVISVFVYLWHVTCHIVMKSMQTFIVLRNLFLTVVKSYFSEQNWQSNEYLMYFC